MREVIDSESTIESNKKSSSVARAEVSSCNVQLVLYRALFEESIQHVTV